MKYLLIIAIGLLTLNSCTQKQALNPDHKMEQDFYNNSWLLMDEDNSFQSFVNKKVFFAYNKENKTINGFAGCNAFFSHKFNLTTNKISFGMIGGTKKYCPNIKEESTFLSLLGSANIYKIEDNILYLYKDNLLLLKFKKETI